MQYGTLNVIDGHTFDVAKNKGKRYVAIPELERLLGWRADSARKKLKSKSLKTFAGKSLTVGKFEHPQGGTMNYLTTEDLSLLVTWEGAINRNRTALTLIPVFMAEALNRNIDAVVDDVQSEKTHEDERREFYRLMAKSVYHPQLTAEMNGCFKGHWGREVNKVKAAFGLPLTPVDGWGQDELRKWIDGISRYNCLRKMDKTHKQALQEITRQRIDREVLK